MKFCCMVLSFLVIFQYCNCWTSYNVNPHTYKGKGCYASEIGEMRNGEVRPMTNGCGQILCMPPNLRYDGCPVISVSNKCSITPSDLSKAYPHCCPSITCP